MTTIEALLEEANLLFELHGSKDCRSFAESVTTKVGDLIRALDEISELAAWHADLDAEPDDDSPDDMTAHVNGLIIKLCDGAIGK